ncbi:MAG: glycerol-3-phosphate 1-O-acyltransferase PlsY [Candidatus Omnitrophica bacterium]|nr:glycerol-3-phosphate 1-O-acyltransferase PlsY [Candidatus Omnitrophota bacterium]
MNIFWIGTGLLLSYLIGAIPTAYIITKVVLGKDIRKMGSGNIGATNTLRVAGKLPGVIVLVADVLKGVAAVTILAFFVLEKVTLPVELIRSLFGLAAVCGHILNVFLRFKGGKGVAVSAGVMLGVAPQALLIGIIFFIIIVAVTKYVSLGSILSSIVIPFFLLWTKAHYSYVVLSAVLCVIIVAKHKPNIKRLLCGREGKVFEKK